MGNCTLHFIQWYAVGVAGASEGEGKNGRGKIFWHAVFLQPVISHFESVALVWITGLNQLRMQFKLQMTSFHCWGVPFFFMFSLQFLNSHFSPIRVSAEPCAWWRCLRLPSDPVRACKSRVSPLIMACHLHLTAPAASSLSFPSQRPWLLSCCLTLKRRLHVVH